MSSSRLPDGVAAIVLAAGEGRRFRAAGGEFKLLAKLPNGRSVIRTVCELATQVAETTCVVARCELAAVHHELQGLPLDVVACPDAVAGPGAALRAGVAHTSSQQPLLVFLADMPWVTSATVHQVRSALLSGAEVVRPEFAGRPGHPVGFAPAWRARLSALPDKDAAGPLLRQHADCVMRLPVTDQGCVQDVDLPQDLLPR